MNATPEIDTNSVRISHHARIRAATRLGVVKARERIRELLSKAEKVDVPYVRNAKAYRAGGVVLVISADGETVETVLQREVEA